MAEDVRYFPFEFEEMWVRGLNAYYQYSPNVLYPGDEKEIFLRGAAAFIAQLLAGADTSLRMATLTHALRSYLDIQGADRHCMRIEAQAAEATVEITFAETMAAGVIPAGTALTAADGNMVWLLKEEVTRTGAAESVAAAVVCKEAGMAGNGLQAGMQLQFAAPEMGVISVYCIGSAAGGRDAEEDEAYRERIRNYGLTSVTTGPSAQYERVAKAVSTDILDAKALHASAGCVAVYLRMAEEADKDGLKAQVLSALTPVNIRPLTDSVEVLEVVGMPYTLNAVYVQPDGSDLTADMEAVVREYQAWQDETIGRAFNPDKLKSMMYQAGATRVTWGDGSSFNGGEVDYTEIGQNECCIGVVTVQTA